MPRLRWDRKEVSFDLVETEMRRRTFGVLSTESHDGRPHSAGVLYGVSSPERPLALYVKTNRDSKKARNVAHNPNVSFVISLPRRLLSFFPPISENSLSNQTKQ